MFNFPSFRRRPGKKPDGCPDCGAEISGDWEFCPKCGARLWAPIREEEKGIPSLFSGFDLFADIDKQLEEMDKAFFGGRNSLFEIPRTATQPRPQRASQSGDGAQVRGGGISIAFSGGTGMPPKVTIHTSGDFRSLEPELRKKFGIQEQRQKLMEEELQGEEPTRQAPPEMTEEPEAELVKGAGGRISVLKVKLPDVKSAKDIKISRLPNSIEIKAYVKNKAYFKLFQVPLTSRVAGTGFKNGVLTISFE